MRPSRSPSGCTSAGADYSPQSSPRSCAPRSDRARVGQAACRASARGAWPSGLAARPGRDAPGASAARIAVARERGPRPGARAERVAGGRRRSDDARAAVDRVAARGAGGGTEGRGAGRGHRAERVGGLRRERHHRGVHARQRRGGAERRAVAGRPALRRDVAPGHAGGTEPRRAPVDRAVPSVCAGRCARAGLRGGCVGGEGARRAGRGAGGCAAGVGLSG